MTNQLSLLYVEDDPEILENVAFLLSRFVKQVYTAADGEEALEKYAMHSPDIIVLDINIPKIDGLDVAQKIRNENTEIPIMIISAYDSADNPEKVSDIKVSSYLKKPFTFKQLKEALNALIEEKTHHL